MFEIVFVILGQQDTFRQIMTYGHPSYVRIWRQRFPSKGKSKCQGPEAGIWMAGSRPSKEAPWLETDEQKREQEGDKKAKYFINSLEGHGKDFGIHSG